MRRSLVAGVVVLVVLGGGWASAVSSGSDTRVSSSTVTRAPAEGPDGNPPITPSPTLPPSPTADLSLIAAPSPTAAPSRSPRPVKADPRARTGKFGVQLSTGSKGVALTFDDGPDPTWTPKVLDHLRRARVKATFCVIGAQVRRHPALVARIAREGHTLCNHSWRHDLDLGKRAPAAIRADLLRTNREIQKAAPGAQVRYYRQPGGRWTARVAEAARELGMIPLGWDVDPRDWTKPGAEEIRRRVLATARAGSVVLLHDGGGDRRGTVAACPKVITALRQRYGITVLR